MGNILDKFVHAFRAFNVDGLPSSGAYRPVKADIVAIGAAIENLITVSGIADDIYTDVSAGLAATTNGQLFLVKGTSANSFADLYLNNAGAAVDQGISLPSLAAIENSKLAIADAEPLLAFTDFQDRIYSFFDQAGDLFNADGTNITAAARRVVPAVNDDVYTFSDGAGRSVGAITPELDLRVGAREVFRDIDALRAASDGAGATGRYRFYTFTSDTEQLRVFDGPDAGRFPWQRFATVRGLPAGHTIRDPSVRRDRYTGLLWMAYTAWSFQVGPSFASFGLLVSRDGLDWTYVATIAPPVTGAQTAWAPEWLEDDRGRVCVVVACNINGAYDPADSSKRLLKQFVLRATKPDLTSFELVGQMTGTAVPNNVIDTHVVYANGFYQSVIKDETAGTLRLSWATTATGPYDQVVDLSGWGTQLEGPQRVRLPGGIQRIYYDRFGGSPAGLQYRESNDGGATWGAETSVASAVARHGSIFAI